MDKNAKEFLDLCLVIEHYWREESIKYNEEKNILNFLELINNFNNSFDGIDFEKLEKNTIDKIKKKHNEITNLFKEKIKFMIPNKNLNYLNEKIIYFLPYIIRYNINMKKIEDMLDKANSYILKIENELNNPIKKINNFFDISELCSYELLAATLLRYIIEIVVNQSILNNNGKINNKCSKFYDISFADLINKLNEEEIDYTINSLDDTYSKEEFKFKYFKNDFWKNIKNTYKELNKIIHYQLENDENIKSDDINSYINKNKPYVDNIKCLRKIHDYIYLSLKKHIVFFENGNCKAICNDFNINLQNINNIFFDDLNNEVTFEEVKN